MATLPFCICITTFGLQATQRGLDIYIDGQSMVLYVDFLDSSVENVVIQALICTFPVFPQANSLQSHI
jgi:hypothetical protein